MRTRERGLQKKEINSTENSEIGVQMMAGTEEGSMVGTEDSAVVEAEVTPW